METNKSCVLARTRRLMLCFIVDLFTIEKQIGVSRSSKNMENLLFAAIVYAFPGTYNIQLFGKREEDNKKLKDYKTAIAIV